jgi:hypothetical protein
MWRGSWKRGESVADNSKTVWAKGKGIVGAFPSRQPGVIALFDPPALRARMSGMESEKSAFDLGFSLC